MKKHMKKCVLAIAATLGLAAGSLATPATALAERLPESSAELMYFLPICAPYVDMDVFCIQIVPPPAPPHIPPKLWAWILAH